MHVTKRGLQDLAKDMLKKPPLRHHLCKLRGPRQGRAEAGGVGPGPRFIMTRVCYVKTLCHMQCRTVLLTMPPNVSRHLSPQRVAGVLWSRRKARAMHPRPRRDLFPRQCRLRDLNRVWPPGLRPRNAHLPSSQTATPSKRSPRKKSPGKQLTRPPSDRVLTPEKQQGLPNVSRAAAVPPAASGTAALAAGSHPAHSQQQLRELQPEQLLLDTGGPRLDSCQRLQSLLQQQQAIVRSPSSKLAPEGHSTRSAAGVDGTHVAPPGASSSWSKQSAAQERESGGSSDRIDLDWQVATEPTPDPPYHHSTSSWNSHGHDAAPQLAHVGREMKREYSEAQASQSASLERVSAEQEDMDASGYLVPELLAPAHGGCTSPFAHERSLTNPHSHEQAADIIMTPDFSGLMQMRPTSAVAESGWDLTGDQHLTAQPLFRRASCVNSSGHSATPMPAAAASVHSAESAHAPENAAPLDRSASHDDFIKNVGEDRVLSSTAQPGGRWAHENGGVVQPQALAHKPAPSAGWGQENFAPRQQSGLDQGAGIRSFQDIIGRGILRGDSAETLNLPHLKVMESFLQRRDEQEQARLQLQGYNPSPPGTADHSYSKAGLS